MRRLILYRIVLLTAIGGLLFGFDTGVIAGVLPFIIERFHPSTTMLEAIVSLTLLGALMGTFCSGYLADHWGRRRLLLLCAGLFIIGTLIAALAPQLTLLMLGRWVIGLAIGLACYTVPLYIAEISPREQRGRLVLCNGVAITAGQALAFYLDYQLAAQHLWRWMIGIGIIPAIALGFSVLFAPESPRWLIRHQRLDAAKRALVRLGLSTQAATAKLNALIETLGTQSPRVNWRLLWQPNIRRAVWIGLALGLFQQGMGINTVMYYGPLLMKAMGIQRAQAGIWATFILGSVNAIMTLITLLIVDKVGRRPLLIIGTFIAAISLIAVGMLIYPALNGYHAARLTMLDPEQQRLALAGLILYIAGYCMSIGSLFWLIIAEIYPLEIRGLAMSVTAGVQWAANMLVSATALTLIQWIGLSGTFWLYGGISLLACLFCTIHVPETNQLSLEKINRVV